MDWNALVCEIVHVPHRAPSTPPSDMDPDNIIRAIIAAFNAFCAQASDADRAALAPALEKLEHFPSKWLPAYGCVVFASPAGYNALSHVVLLYPDIWQSNLSCRSFGQTSFVPPSSSTVRDLGTIPTDDVEKFETNLVQLLDEDAKRHSNSRKACNGEHRETPYLVEALAHRAIAFAGKATAQGNRAVTTEGETPVPGVSGAIHIGTQPRATAYPLVEAALLYFVVCPRTFRRLRVHFLLWLANQFKVTAQMDSINTAMNLVDAIALAAMDMDDHGASVDAITDQVQAVRTQLNDTYSQARKAKDRQLHLTPIEPKEATSPVLTSDALEPKDWSTQPLTTQERQALALANSGALPTFPQQGAVTRASFEQLLAWINSHPRLTAGQDARLLVFSEIHALMWSCAKHLSATESPLDLSVADVSAVDALVTTYSTMMTAWLTSKHGEQQMMVKLRSYEVVVTWVGYCLVHQHCARAFPLVQEYASPLDWTHLRCLVLEDKRAIDAARLVAGYIRRINMVSDLELFSLAETTGSVQFSRRFAEQCPEMELRLAHEKKALATEMDKYMRKVREKQDKVAALRAQLPSLQSTLDRARCTHANATREQQKIRDEEERERWSQRFGGKSAQMRDAERATHNAYNNMNEAERALNAKNTEIARALVPPQFVVCPLPESDDRARSVLFFFMIPSSLNILARLSAASQYTLVPRPPGDVLLNINVTAPSPSWTKHYNDNMFQHPGCRPASPCHWTIFPHGFGIPKSVGPNSVDGITQARPSFWFPNKFELGMQWSTGLNPFMANPSQMEAFFTDQLQERKLQWIMEFPASAAEGDSSRGNLPYANLFMQPHGLSKIEYLTLGSLRAFPNQQLRKLVQALHASTLPLSHPLVLRAICQMIYHVGDLSDTDSMELLWKRDLELGWLVQWHDGLSIQIDLLRDTIRDYKSFVAAVVMASYLSQFYPPARELARELADIAKKWVDITRAERLDGRSSESHRLELRAKECLMYGYGILAMSSVGDFTTEDARKLVEFVVMFRYGLLFGDGSSIQAEVAWVQVQVANVMASRINAIIDTLLSTSDGDNALSHSIRGVFTLPNSTIRWTRVPQSTCYETTISAHTEPEHYLINVLTGCVLLNGSPPSRLPRTILTHATYKRYFGSQDFEVGAKSGSIFRTTHPFDGANLEFTLVNSTQLRIEAVYPDRRRLELIEFAPDTWFDGLPTRLREMHSHWVDRTNNLLVFRPPTFQSRGIYFFAKLDGPSRCFEVPMSNHHLDILDVVGMEHSYRYFVDASKVPSIASVLSKFEQPEYVHAMLTPAKDLHVHMPRFGLTFQGLSSNPRSLDFSEFQLATTQQRGHLPLFFQQYLVLERIVHVPGQPSVLLLVPSGQVRGRNDGSVAVQVEKDCDASLTYYTYEVAPHSNQVTATSIVSRLHLAAIFAASSCSLPDPHLGMTGSEMALLLLRQCWTSRPWTEGEAQALANLASFSHKEPALAVLCDRFAKQALDRVFLYQQDTAHPAPSPRGLVCRSKCELRALSSSALPWNQRDHLPLFFQQYLVLERVFDVPGQPSILLLVPSGQVRARKDGSVVVQVEKDCDASLTYYTYEVAPHSNQVTATSIVSRLHLAAIFAASSCSLPDPHLGMTGSELALLLLRQCWTSRPWTEGEAIALANLASFSHKEPALAVLCDRFAKQSLDRVFLYQQAPAHPTPSPHRHVCRSKCELRALSSSSFPWNACRRNLHPHEMTEALGPVVPPQTHELNPGKNAVTDLPRCPVAQDSVANVEKAVLSMVTIHKNRAVRPFPLKKWKGTAIEDRITSDLETSWMHLESMDQAKPSQRSELEGALLRMQQQVERDVDALKAYLANAVTQTIPPRFVNRMRLRMACNRLPTITPHDVLLWATAPNDVLHFNPYMSPNAIEAFQQAVHLYLASCVLNARLRRLVHLVQANAPDAVVLRELQVTRTWSINEHPRWLVFEVEGSLQIRPEQANIALHLIKEKSGTICQLNMGLGKTRVILPMLILHYTALGHVPRVHILGPILQESLAFLHQHLCASTLGIRILDQPFQRQVELTSFGMTILGQPIANACYVVAPEHRLSLEMKLQEWMYEGDEKATELAALLTKQHVDIFDECDALLHHRFQLVYAMGTPTKLDNCDTRAKVAQGLLDVVNTCHDELQDWIDRHGLQNATTSKCQYRGIRLKVDVSEDNLVTFRRLVLRQWIEHPSAREWFRDWANKGAVEKETLLRCILNKDTDIADIASIMKGKPQLADLLALRGFLGFGILEHCLQQRPRVQYGVDPNRQPKRLAIPFRAADVPSARAEFGHPDISIFLTTLAYYYQGLSAAQVLEALGVLLSMSASARSNEYDSWFAPIRDELEPKDAQMLDNCSKLDKSNAPQMALLVDKLAKSTNLINFWLLRCVFTTDLAQYPARIATSSWNLAQSDNSMGFSGTNESNPILPGQIVPNEPPIPALLATNGHMLDLLLTCTDSVHALADGVVWQTLVDFVVDGGYDALIDTGSLLAAISNEKISAYMLAHRQLDAKFRAIVYFDPAKDCWMSLGRATRSSVPLHDSPIKERDSFVLFDDARSRGTDMKMHAAAVAVLTLGPKLTKEKLMQGAGRLRLLGKDQRVAVAVPPEIQQALPDLNMPAILKWVVENTAATIESGFSAWSQQGLAFCKSKQAGFQSVVDEHWALDELYETPLNVQQLASVVRAQVDADHGGCDMAARIADHCATLAAEVEVITTSFGEECERELQLEEEEEQEQEVERVVVTPALESSWAYQSMMTAKSAPGVSTSVLALPEAVKKSWGSTNLSAVAWPDNVYTTASFLKTIEAKAVIEFARLVDMVVVFSNRDVLLLSDKEADAMLELTWNRSQAGPSTISSLPGVLMALGDGLSWMANISMLRFAARGTQSALKSLRCPLSEHDDVVLALFNGETRFDRAKQPSLSQLLAQPPSRQAIEKLVDARGELRNWVESDLEKVVKMLWQKD